MKHLGSKTLITKRLILRKITLDDASSMFNNWASDDEVSKYLTWPTHKTIDDSKCIISLWVDSYKNKNFYNWVIYLKEIDDVIGNVSIMNINEELKQGELGYCIAKKYWGQGIMKEAAFKIMEYLFLECGFHEIIAKHDINNTQSKRVMEKLNMKYVKTIKGQFKNNQGIVDVKLHSIKKDEFLKTRFYKIINTKLGEMVLIANYDKALIGTYFLNESGFDVNSLKCMQNIDIPLFDEVKKWFDEYFENKVELPINFKYELIGTPFQIEVWNEIKKIKFGQSITYKNIADNILKNRSDGSKISYQSIGRAVGKNPLTIIIGCHRVIGSNHKIVGYSGGIKRKIYLLNHENINFIPD